MNNTYVFKRSVLQAAIASALCTLLVAPAVLPGSVAAQARPAATLQTVEVTASATPNEAVNAAYKPIATRVGKTLQDPHDIPQAVTTITRPLMEDQNADSLKDALRNVAGLTFNAAEGGRSGDNMMLRGFYTFGDMYLDGMRDTAQYNRELFNLEQVDVLRGSAAMLYGRGQAGGVINQSSKTPMLVDRHKVSGAAGTQSYGEFLGDFNKVLGQDTALRINMMKRQEGSSRSNPASGATPQIKRDGVAVAYGYGIGTANEFQLSHLRTRVDDKPDYGMSFNPVTHRVNTNFDTNTYWGIDKNFDTGDTNLSTASYTYRFSPKTEVKNQLRVGDYDRSYWAKTPNGTLAPTATGSVGGNPTRASHYKTVNFQSDLNSRLKLAGTEHEILLGLEILKEDAQRSSLQNFGTTTAPDYRPYVMSTTAIPVKFKGDSYSVYVQDSVSFAAHWKATAGLRRDWLKAEYSSLTSPNLRFGENSARMGISYQPTDAAHYYLNHSNSFSPTADLYQLSGGAYPAERSKTLELGAKWQLLGDKLTLRTALFDATKEWERNTDLESTAAILTKKRNTKGLEIEAAGRVGTQWEVFAGLSLLDAKIKEVAQNRNATTRVITLADPRLAGQAARNTPKYAANLWSVYKINPHWKLGLGAEYKAQRTAYVPSTANASSIFTGAAFTPNTVPSYLKYDAMLAYEQGPWLLRLNVKNLTDKKYFDALYDNGGFAVPGNRRSAQLSVERRFD